MVSPENQGKAKVENDSSQANWLLGSTVELCPTKDGVIRVVKILPRGYLAMRTVDRLVLLELSSLTLEEG